MGGKKNYFFVGGAFLEKLFVWGRGAPKKYFTFWGGSGLGSPIFFSQGGGPRRGLDTDHGLSGRMRGLKKLSDGNDNTQQTG